jgi:pSer/pThr/pTyr-binding forkhead associated (FHA) protein
VSRQHAQIRMASGAATVEDLGSKNGTWVNGARIFTAVPLHPGDLVCVGVATLTYRLSATDESTSTAGF